MPRIKLFEIECPYDEFADEIFLRVKHDTEWEEIGEDDLEILRLYVKSSYRPSLFLVEESSFEKVRPKVETYLNNIKKDLEKKKLEEAKREQARKAKEKDKEAKLIEKKKKQLEKLRRELGE